MPHRFFCPDLVEVGSVSLGDSEAHHLIHVLRHQPNDIVELFNGEGLVASCKISAVRKRDVELDILNSHRDPPRAKTLILATAVPKGDRFDWLVEKATELGVSRLIPLTTIHSVVDPRSSKLEKLRQTVISACKQSVRNDLMAISPVTAWGDFLKEFTGNNPVFIAHPQGESIDSAIGSNGTANQQIIIGIGPEGGFSSDEVQFAIGSGATAVSLGDHILRIETAAIALAAKLLL